VSFVIRTNDIAYSDRQSIVTIIKDSRRVR